MNTIDSGVNAGKSLTQSEEIEKCNYISKFKTEDEELQATEVTLKLF